MTPTCFDCGRTKFATSSVHCKITVAAEQAPALRQISDLLTRLAAASGEGACICAGCLYHRLVCAGISNFDVSFRSDPDAPSPSRRAATELCLSWIAWAARVSPYPDSKSDTPPVTI